MARGLCRLLMLFSISFVAALPSTQLNSSKVSSDFDGERTVTTTIAPLPDGYEDTLPELEDDDDGER